MNRFFDRLKRLAGAKPNNPQFEHKTGDEAVREFAKAHPPESTPYIEVAAETKKSPVTPSEFSKRLSQHTQETNIANIDRGVAKIFSKPGERGRVQVDHTKLLENCPRLLLDRLTHPTETSKADLVTNHIVAVNFSKKSSGGRAYFVDANAFSLTRYEDTLMNNEFRKENRPGAEMFFYKQSPDKLSEVRIYFVPNLLELIGHEEYKGSINRSPQ